MPVALDKARTIGIVVLATVAGLGALYLARSFFVPVMLSILFAVLLRPLVRWFESLRIPTPIGALIVLFVVLGIISAGGAALATPAREWIAQAPQHVKEAEARLRQLRRPVQQITQAAERMEGAVAGRGESEGGGGRGGGQRTGGSNESSPAAPQAAADMFGSTAAFVAGFVEVLLLTFLLLASGDLFLQKLLHVMPGERSAALKVTRDVEDAVSRYMVATAFINVGQGLIVTLAMALIGFPSPALWGVLTFFCEFVPYLGAAFMLFLLAVVGLASFQDIGHAALAPLAYLLITTLQNNLVSPIAYGRRLRLNPVAVLVGVMFWWFLWGIPGVFLAVPLVATAKILGDHVRSLSAMGEFLAG
jgi:predicted PurR-regulated permease PerM